MSIILNGTTGITTPDITSDSYTGAIAVNASAPDNSLVVNSAGLVGIGTSAPKMKLNAEGTYGNPVTSGPTPTGIARFSQTTNNVTLDFGVTTGNKVWIQGADKGDLSYTYDIAINPNGGSLLVGTTSAFSSSKLSVSGLIGAQQTYGPMYYSNENNTDNVGRASFTFNRGGSLVGQIVTTNSACTYTTVSDYRLKEDWVAVADASTRVNALKPVNFAWKLNGSRVDGFLAHELAEVVPEAATGTKDATEMVDIKDEEGNVTGQEERPVYQGIDQSKLVPLLTAALQEALAAIESLTARVSALEAK
tara:strand:+ start:37 stop:954 length:918 start_codon:yes stop_codon:yes gene_type:complete